MKNSNVILLGKNDIKSPLNTNFIKDGHKILLNPFLDDNKFQETGLEVAGPRQYLYFNSSQVKAGIVTCGGLCPGINSVIRTIVLELWYQYGVKNIIGIPYGYQGLARESAIPFIELEPKKVTDINDEGGSILGTSRGTPPTDEIVESLQRNNINILFIIGGDGTMRGAQKIANLILEKNLKISLIGIPKTIDNDIPFVNQSFGFDTAVSIACQAVEAAHEEARGALRGVGLVKIMGRHSGFIAAKTTLASGNVNFCLIPEVEFSLDGPNGLFIELDKRLEKSGHAVILVAEGAGQYFFNSDNLGYDKSGNKKLGDIGLFLKNKIIDFFNNLNKPVTLKYIDPSYIIRAAPPTPSDRLYCATLAQNAVHAAMSGRTALLIGYWHGVMTHVPLTLLGNETQKIKPEGRMWFNVLQMTGQPKRM